MLPQFCFMFYFTTNESRAQVRGEGRPAKISRKRKIYLKFCLLRWLHSTKSVTYIKYAPSFAAFAALSCGLFLDLTYNYLKKLLRPEPYNPIFSLTSLIPRIVCSII